MRAQEGKQHLGHTFLSHQPHDARAFCFFARREAAPILVLLLSSHNALGLPFSSTPVSFPFSIRLSLHFILLASSSRLPSRSHYDSQLSLSLRALACHLLHKSPPSLFLLSFAMYRRRRYRVISSSDSSEESPVKEPPSAKRVRATKLPVTPRRQRPLSVKASGHDSTQGIEKRRSDHDTEPAINVPAQITPTRRRSSQISGLLAGPVIETSSAVNSLGIPLWAYLGRLLPSNTSRPRKFPHFHGMLD